MNLVEITQLIEHPEVQKDEEMLNFYIGKRAALAIEINEALESVGAPAMTLKQMLLASPNPELAATIEEH